MVGVLTMCHNFAWIPNTAMAGFASKAQLAALVSMLSAVTGLQLCMQSFNMHYANCFIPHGSGVVKKIPIMTFVGMQVCMSTDNLFQRCRQRSKVAHGNVSNPLLQLEAIGNFVSDLGAIKELAQKNNVKSSMQSMPRLDKLSVAGDK